MREAYNARMRETVAQQLLELNREFYQSHGLSFAETRARLQPGVQAAVERVPTGARVLDVGCGHGMVARALGAQGHLGGYLGIDASSVLLDRARAATPDPAFAFRQVELADPRWTDGLPGPFDAILCFAVLHHLPGIQLRAAIAAGMRSLLGPTGSVELSVWNFLASARLRSRIQPWELVGLAPADVDPGDYLLDWRHGANGLRYVHAYDAGELTTLARDTGLVPDEARLSDGESGQLGMYQMWRQPLPGAAFGE
jgi:tRNA (uracil-5-)-methyltransferase TRM9